MSRLSHGGLIDRSKPLTFTFDGRELSGFEGDTLASALVANDVRIIGRSFKYHRPRGLLTAGPEEPNALVSIRSGARAEPNTRATNVTLFEGLEANSQNCWPSPSFDLMAINQLFAPLFVAGFYYKTFMWPAKFWEWIYEPLIRRAAGLGSLSMLPDPDTYDREHGFCDLLIIGGGPAGLAAALTAGRAGLRVILANEDTTMGGRLLAERHEIDKTPGHEWVRATVSELVSLGNVRLLDRTSVFGIYDGHEYAAVERISDHLREPLAGQPRQRFWRIVADRAILATGSVERPIVFGGNDRPGVMTASAVSTYINRFAAAPGKRALVFTTGDSGWATVNDLRRAGIEIAAVVDSRPGDPRAPNISDGVDAPIYCGAVVTDVYGRTVRAAQIRDADGRRHRISCDLVAVAGGWNPAIGLGSNLGARPTWSDAIQSFILSAPPPGLVTAGSAAGRFGLGEALSDGVAAACVAVGEFRKTAASPSRFEASPDPSNVSAVWHVPSKTKAFVDFQHDVTDDDVALAAREGFVSIEHLKRYTTLGMATDQGKTGQLNGHALLAAAVGKPIAETGTIMSRPPYSPVAFGALAGHHRGEAFRPVRRTAAHEWAAQRGATFVNAGQWQRAQWFPSDTDKDWLDTVNREVLATRNGVGVCDVSTLGKIDVQGPDAAKLLDRLYINNIATLPIGKIRYGLMLREDGMALDDGTITRFAEDRFFVTTTTVNAARVMQHIDYARQVIWPELDVNAVSVTENWTTYSVAGPQSRTLIQSVFRDLDLSNGAFPFMAATEFRWKGMPARIYRVSFSGELAYEVSVQSNNGLALLQALFDAGRDLAVVPYGVEALGVMRIEMGHPAGNELNGTTTAGDLRMGRMMSKNKDFIGRAMANRPGLLDADRPYLVGLRSVSESGRIRAGAHLVAPGARAIAANDEGYVTSAAWSPVLGRSIALAVLQRGSERDGEHIVVHDPVRGDDVRAEICNPKFFDPEGERVRG